MSIEMPVILFSWHTLMPLLPEIFVAVVGMSLLIAGVMVGNAMTRSITWAVMAAFFITACFLLGIDWEPETALKGMFVMDEFGGFIKLLLMAGLIAALGLSMHYLRKEQMERFEFPVLVMFAGLGMMMMVSAGDLISLYVGLELQSLSLYVLAAIRRESGRSSEAGLKYFVLGALSSGMLLFGASLIYGYTGSTNFAAIADALQDAHAPGAMIGMVFLLVGIAFKISAVPFHMWTPDVYEGAPTAVTALFAIVPKVAAMALLMRLLFGPFAGLAPEWSQIIWFMSLASMALGAFAALGQENIKRLMAYSSIGNMGYAMIGLVAGTSAGAGAVILYMLIYMVMAAGVFGIIICMRRDGRALENISDLAGLSKTNTPLAYAMAILMFSMSGIPPMAGFFGKLFIFQAAVAQGYFVLATLGIVTSVIAAYYYLRIIKVMFFDEAADPLERDVAFAGRAVILVCVIFVLGFIIKPQPFVDSTTSAATVLFAG